MRIGIKIAVIAKGIHARFCKATPAATGSAPRARPCLRSPHAVCAP
jgi:hypothetical protein